MALIALTRAVSASLADCELTHLPREPIDVARARRQHEAYEQTLVGLGCRVERLPELPACPDAVFVEDVAVVVDEHAVITRPGAASRRAETASAAEELAAFRTLTTVSDPGTLDGGDVLRLGRRVFVGRSSRSNDAGVEALRGALEPFGYSVQSVEVRGCLHLKSAATEVASGVVLVNPAWVDPRMFGAVRTVEVDPREPLAANGLRVGNALLHGAGFPGTRRRLEALGLQVVPIDLSELAKAEGAVTCCSIVFQTY